MILYNQNGQFLGIGAYELVLLGFEDMADFLKHHSDFKELIVEEEGYISASTTYSWLDYIRYSGASDKKILIQTHEDGKRIEAGVKISEVHLTSHTEEASFFYALELTKPPMHPTREMDNAPKVLPIDPFDYRSIDQIRVEDFDFELSTTSNSLLYDLVQCSEKLGIDIHTLAQKVEAYLASLESNVANIDTLVQQNQLPQAKKELNTLKKYTRELRITSLYRPLQAIENLLQRPNEALYVEALISLRNAINVFKEQLA